MNINRSGRRARLSPVCYCFGCTPGAGRVKLPSLEETHTGFGMAVLELTQ